MPQITDWIQHDAWSTCQTISAQAAVKVLVDRKLNRRVQRSFISLAAASPQQRDKARPTGVPEWLPEQTLQLCLKDTTEQSLQVVQQTQAGLPISHSVPTART
jgi:hypothetical protein